MDYLIEFDYEADEPDELSIHKGDIVNKVKHHEDGWLFGILRGKEGVFPSNFGKPLKDERKRSQEDEIDAPPVNDDNRMSTSIDDEETVDNTVKNQKKVVGVGFGNIFSGGQIQLKQTSRRDMKPKQSPSEEVKSDIHIEKKPSMKAKVEMVRAIHGYTAENSDELTLEEGDIITVLDKDNEDEGWWKGKHANGAIGVFPDNFVEPIKNTQEEAPRPLRPTNVVAGKPAPPVLAAKPNIQFGKNVPPRPPQLLDVKAAPSKPSTRLSHLDKDDGISFDEPLNHKPLVGPNAGRAKRPGKKLPTNINVVVANNPEDEVKKNITQKIDNFSHETSDIIIPKQKPKDHSNFNEIKSPEIVPDFLSSKPKPKENFPIEKTPDKVPEFFTKQKSKENLPSEKITEKAPEKVPEFFTSKQKPKENFAEKTTEIIEPKRFNNFKASTLPQKNLIETGDVKSKNEGDTLDDADGLKLKISNLEVENTELRNEVKDLRKSAMSTADQVNHLANKLNKLIKEFDEEKTKRVANEVNITRLKDTVEDLETAMLSRSSK